MILNAVSVEFHTHYCSEGLNSLLYDCIHDGQASTVMDNSRYVLKVNPNQQAELYLIDQDYTFILKSVSLDCLPNAHCLVCIDKGTFQRYVLWNGKQIVNYTSRPDGTGHISLTQSAQTSVPLQKGEQITYLSRAVEIHQHDVLIAYTSFNACIMILLTQGNKTLTVEAFRLNDPDQPKKGFFNLDWFNKSQPPKAYQRVELSLYAEDGPEQRFKLLMVEDHKVSVYQVALQQEKKNSTIKKLASVDVNTQTQERRLSQVLMATQDKQNYRLRILYKQKSKVGRYDEVVHVYEGNLGKNSSQLGLEYSTLTAASFEVTLHEDKIYYHYFEQSSRTYHVVVRPTHEPFLSTEGLFNCLPVLSDQQRIHFCTKGEKIYLITPTKVYAAFASGQQVVDEGVSPQRSHFLKLMSKLDKSIDRRVKRLLSNEMYSEILPFIRQRESELEEWFDHFSRLEPQIEKSVLNDFTKEVICTSTICHFLSSPQYPPFYKSLVETALARDQKVSGVVLINEAVSEQSPQAVGRLMGLLPQRNFERYLVSILQEVHALKHQDLSIMKEVFRDAVSFILTSFQGRATETIDLGLYKELIAYSIGFMRGEAVLLNVHMVRLVEQFGEVDFAKNNILNYNLLQSFIHFFTKSPQVFFEAGDLRDIVGNLNDPRSHEMHDFVRNLLQACRVEYDQGEEKKQLIIKRVPVLVSGLEQFSEQLMPLIRTTFPGLTFFMYMMAGAREQGRQEILDLAQKVENKPHQYTMRLAVHDPNDILGDPLTGYEAEQAAV